MEGKGVRADGQRCASVRHQSGGWEELDTLAGRVSRRGDRIWGEGSAAKILAMPAQAPYKRLCSVACTYNPVQGRDRRVCRDCWLARLLQLADSRLSEAPVSLMKFKMESDQGRHMTPIPYLHVYVYTHVTNP